MPSPPMLLPFPIPDSILLLIHLHLLQWPQADLPCDPDAFNANRHGIGERIKSMEHIIYFLIEKIEGIRGAKTLLSMYPCKQPSDTTAFRIAVIKYLETLRTNALKPQPAKALPATTASTARNTKKPSPLPSSRAPAVATRQTSLGSKANPSNRSVSVSTEPGSTPSSACYKHATTARSASVNIPKGDKPLLVARRANLPASKAGDEPILGWWWKDSPVRKTLLEECTGPRFERLLLALSIHALVVCHSKVENIQQNYVETLKGACVAQNIDLFHMLVDQPEDYKSLTQRIQSIQIRMKVEEVSLKQRAHQVAALQTPRPTEGTLNISLDELQNSRDSLFQKLESGLENLSTEGTGATSTLSWLFSLSKTTGTPTSEATPSAPGNGETNKRRLTARKTILPPPPLPTAVAQHPSYIDMLNELEPQLNDFSAGIPDDVHEGQKGKEPSRDLALFALATDQEANLTASLEQFKAEMIQLATLVDQQLQIKEAAAIDEYMSAKQEELEENNHEQGEPSESMLPNLWTLDHELDLNFEFLSERKSFALSVLSGFRSEIMAGIRSSIQVPFQREEDIESVSSSSIMDEGDVGGEEDGGLDSSSDDKDADQSVVNPSMRSPLKSPQKTSKIPLYVQTPKSSRERKVPALPQTITPPRSNILLQSLATPKTRNYTSSPSKRRSQAGLRTPPPRDVMATPSFFFSPSKNMENLKDILPPFQSPWRSVTRSRTYNHSPRKSGRVSIGRPRLSIHRPRLSGARLGSSSSFIRTPLKSGKRLSNIIAPIQYTPIHRLGNATPRASLDDVYEEIVDDLINESNVKTPPLSSSSSSRRLLAVDNSIQRASPFKTAGTARSALFEPQSPEVELLESDQSFQSSSTIIGMTKHADGWEDEADEVNDNASANQPPAKAKTLRFADEEIIEEPSFTLQDILLRAGRDGMMGINGTFDVDLLYEPEMDVGEDSFLAGL